MTEPAEVFSPAEYLRDELEARGWTAEEFAARSNLSPFHVRKILSGQVRITATRARLIADALGTSATVWLNLDAAWADTEMGESDG